MKSIRRVALIFVAALSLGLLSILPAAAQLDEADALNKRVIELVQAKKFAEAAPMAQRVLAMRESKLGRDHADVVAARKMLAQIYRALGRNAEAEAVEKGARQTFELSAAPSPLTAARPPVPPPQAAPRVPHPASPPVGASPPSASSRDVPLTTRSMRPPAPPPHPAAIRLRILRPPIRLSRISLGRRRRHRRSTTCRAISCRAAQQSDRWPTRSSRRSSAPDMSSAASFARRLTAWRWSHGSRASTTTVRRSRKANVGRPCRIQGPHERGARPVLRRSRALPGHRVRSPRPPIRAIAPAA